MTSTRVHWIETEYCEADPIAVIQQILSGKCTGQIIVNVSQGTPSKRVVWRERRVEQVALDTQRV